MADRYSKEMRRFHRQFVRDRLRLVKSVFSPSDSNRNIAANALRNLYDFVKNEDNADTIMRCDGVTVLIKILQDTPVGDTVTYTPKYNQCILKYIAVIIARSAEKEDYQTQIFESGVLPSLIHLLKTHNQNSASSSKTLSRLLQSFCNAIRVLAHRNSNIQKSFMKKGGMLPLVQLLFINQDQEVLKEATRALSSLALDNDVVIHLIGRQGVLRALLMLFHLEDPSIHYEVVKLIQIMVGSFSVSILMDVMETGVIYPVISLLSSSSPKTKIAAARVVGLLARTSVDSGVSQIDDLEIAKVYRAKIYIAHIAQGGAIKPLLDMLKSSNEGAKEASTSALFYLAKDIQNQGAIVCNGGLKCLLHLSGSSNQSIQLNASLCLAQFLDSKNFIEDIFKLGGYQKLMDIGVVNESLDALKQYFRQMPLVLERLIYLLRRAKKDVRYHMAIALAHLCSRGHHETVFIKYNGLELLLELLQSTILKLKRDASLSLYYMTTKFRCNTFHAPSRTAQAHFHEEDVNDYVRFKFDDDSEFYVNISCLSSCDVFHTMFSLAYRERETKKVEIKNIQPNVFDLMMRFVHGGKIDEVVDSDIAHSLLIAAEQFLLEDLKLLCEHTLSKEINVANILQRYEMSVRYNAKSLQNECILFVLKTFDELAAIPKYDDHVPEICNLYDFLVQKMLPTLRCFMSDFLTLPDARCYSDYLNLFT